MSNDDEISAALSAFQAGPKGQPLTDAERAKRGEALRRFTEDRMDRLRPDATAQPVRDDGVFTCEACGETLSVDDRQADDMQMCQDCHEALWSRFK